MPCDCKDKCLPCVCMTGLFLPLLALCCPILCFVDVCTDDAHFCFPEHSIGWPSCLACPSLVIAMRNCYNGKVGADTIHGYAAIGNTCCLMCYYSDHLQASMSRTAMEERLCTWR